jgi:quercetin dioxygenase-like cupin family protein
MKLTTKHVAAICISLPALLAPVIAQEGVKRTPLATFDSPPGYQTVMGLAQLLPNTCSGRHNHPGIESSYILEGDELLKVDGKPDQHLKPGDPSQIRAGVPHDACTTGGVKVLTVHIIEKGKPLGSPVP